MKPIALLVVALTFLSCGKKSDTSSTKLVGGSKANPGEFHVVAGLISSYGNINCTAARVGKQHILLAAHCLTTQIDDFESLKNSPFVPGFQFQFYSRAQKKVVPITLEARYVDDSWLTTPKRDLAKFEAQARDLAVLKIKETLSEQQWPIGTVSYEPILKGTELIVSGYGCEDGIHGKREPWLRLKTQPSFALEKSAMFHHGSIFLNSTHWGNIAYESKFFTPGVNFHKAFPNSSYQQHYNASLCPGDSGGPVFLDDGTQKTIVGVNAYYTFLNKQDDSKGISVTNIHTRLDGEAKTFLKSALSK